MGPKFNVRCPYNRMGDIETQREEGHCQGQRLNYFSNKPTSAKHCGGPPEARKRKLRIPP